nr:immunoglobulin light chain junction region [Macaca mulatta]
DYYCSSYAGSNSYMF